MKKFLSLRSLAAVLLLAATFAASASAAGASSATAGAESFGGLGISILPSANGVEVVGVVAGGPADMAGIQKGDNITQVGSQSLAGLSFDAKRDALRGKAGTLADLSYTRAGEARSASVTRIALTVSPIEAQAVTQWYGRSQNLSSSELNYLASQNENERLLSVMQYGLPIGADAENLTAQGLQGVYTVNAVAPDLNTPGASLVNSDPTARVKMLNANGQTVARQNSAVQYPVKIR